jgi:hypothetical protein
MRSSQFLRFEAGTGAIAPGGQLKRSASVPGVQFFPGRFRTKQFIIQLMHFGNPMVTFLKQNQKYSYTAAFAGSVVFSVIAIICEPYLNHDGIFYIDAAKAFLEDGFVNSFKAYPWPFYSYLIAVFHLTTGIGLEVSAFLLNSLMIGLTCVVFVKIYDEITLKQGNLWVACILILTANIINKYRDDVMRDFGYWCFTLIGVYCLIRYFKTPKWNTAFGWQISIAAAFLFRIEAIAFLVFGPLVVFLKSKKRKALKEFFLLQAFSIIAITSTFLGFFFYKFESFNLGTTRLMDIIIFIDFNSVKTKFNQAVSNIGNIFFYDGLNLDKYFLTLGIVLLAAMVVYCIIKIIVCLSIPYAGIFIYGALKRWAPVSTDNKLILFFIGLQVFVLSTYLINNYLIVPRYTAVLVFMLLLITGQMIEYGFKNFTMNRYKKISIAILSGLILLQTGDALITFSGYSKSHIVKAGVWVKENLDKSTPIISTDLKAIYYGDRRYVVGSEIKKEEMLSDIESKQFPSDSRLIIHGKEEEWDTVVKKINSYINSGDIKIEKDFRNNKGDWVLILKIS